MKFCIEYLYKILNIFKKELPKTVAFLIMLPVILCFSGCIDTSNKNPVITIVIDENNENIAKDKKPIDGTIQIELYPEKAPNSVSYFLDLLMNGKYNNFPVSKAMAGGAVTFGDPWMMKQIRTEIKGEFKDNGFEQNDIEFKRGTVALDRFVPGDYDSASGDFFVLLDDSGAEVYQDKYAAIGEVISGIEVLDEISQIKVYPGEYSPVFKLMIEETTAELYGVTYDKPVVQDRRTYPGINSD